MTEWIDQEEAWGVWGGWETDSRAIMHSPSSLPGEGGAGEGACLDVTDWDTRSRMFVGQWKKEGRMLDYLVGSRWQDEGRVAATIPLN